MGRDGCARGGANTPWSSGAEGGCGYMWTLGSHRMEQRSQGFCDSGFRSRDQTGPGYPLLFLMPVPVLIVEGVLLLLVISCLDTGGLELGIKPLGRSRESLEPCFQS